MTISYEKHISNNHLTSFLYELMRDHMPMGLVAEIIEQDLKEDTFVLTNENLAQCAEKYASYIMQGVSSLPARPLPICPDNTIRMSVSKLRESLSKMMSVVQRNTYTQEEHENTQHLLDPAYTRDAPGEYDKDDRGSTLYTGILQVNNGAPGIFIRGEEIPSLIKTLRKAYVGEEPLTDEDRFQISELCFWMSHFEKFTPERDEDVENTGA